MPKYKEVVINAQLKPEILLTDFLRKAINANIQKQVKAESDNKTE